MRAIIEIFLAIIFTIILGSSGVKVLSATIKKEVVIKVYGGLGSLEEFTKKFTK